MWQMHACTLAAAAAAAAAVVIVVYTGCVVLA
jgi:hypothetical protein